MAATTAARPAALGTRRTRCGLLMRCGRTSVEQGEGLRKRLPDPPYERDAHEQPEGDREAMAATTAARPAALGTRRTRCGLLMRT